MNKYLIFRTDRIGDFFLSAILVKSIKENDPFAYVTLVASQKNYNYIKDFKLVDDVILLKNTIFDKIRLIFKLKNEKFHSIIIHDQKKRSHLISFFLKRKNKISLNNSLNFSHIKTIKNILNKLNYTFYETALNIFENKNLKKF
jgi:ADP-heptose:LPS heptosyltransferase